MATRNAIAIKRATAIDRLDSGLAIVAAELGVELPAIPKASKARQQEMLQARQLEAFADTIWLIIDAMDWREPEPEPTVT